MVATKDEKFPLSLPYLSQGNALNQCTKYTHNKTIALTDNKLHYLHEMFYMLHVFNISPVSIINKIWCWHG